MHVRCFRFRLSWGYSCLLIFLIGRGTMAAVPFALAQDQATIEAPVTRVVEGRPAAFGSGDWTRPSGTWPVALRRRPHCDS